jgi:hypothetical protein
MPPAFVLVPCSLNWVVHGPLHVTLILRYTWGHLWVIIAGVEVISCKRHRPPIDSVGIGSYFAFVQAIIVGSIMVRSACRYVAFSSCTSRVTSNERRSRRSAFCHCGLFPATWTRLQSTTIRHLMSTSLH